jgi:hypothetical protein
VLGPTPAELDNAREQLDQAQEELVGLMERCDRLEQELEVARRKNRVYQVLHSAAVFCGSGDKGVTVWRYFGNEYPLLCYCCTESFAVAFWCMSPAVCLMLQTLAVQQLSFPFCGWVFNKFLCDY